MSKAGPNFPIITLARQLVLDDLASPDEDDCPQYFADTPVYSFILPDITVFPEDFKAFLYHDLIDNYTLVSLEQSGLSVCHSQMSVTPALLSVIYCRMIWIMYCSNNESHTVRFPKPPFISSFFQVESSAAEDNTHMTSLTTVCIYKETCASRPVAN